MVAHELAADAAQRLVYRSELPHDVRAVPILFDHLVGAPYLPLDPLEAGQVSLFRVGVDCNSLTCIGRRAARDAGLRTFLGGDATVTSFLADVRVQCGATADARGKAGGAQSLRDGGL